MKRLLKEYQDMDDFSDIEKIVWYDKPVRKEKSKIEDVKTLYNKIFSEKNDLEIGNDLSKRELKICPTCGVRVVSAPIDIIQTEGVGPTYSQEHYQSFSIHCDLVCPKCATVYGETTRKIDQY